MSDSLAALAERWRNEAMLFEECGVSQTATTLRRCADQLEHERATYATELLTVDEAARESGYSRAHLYRLIESGELVNLGGKGSPRVRRADLPRKGTRQRQAVEFADEIVEARSGRRCRAGRAR